MGSRLQFENKVTVGTLLTILVLIVGAVTGYATLQAELARHNDRLGSLEQGNRDQASDTRALNLQTDARLRAVETMQASQTSDLKNIQTGIDDIKAAIAQLQASQRGAK